MTASTRPDMTLEQIINRQIDYADEVATRRDLLSLYAEALSAETPGSKRWTFALFRMNQLMKRITSSGYAAYLWADQRDRSYVYYVGRYPRWMR
jgi:hypothetical protein